MSHNSHNFLGRKEGLQIRLQSMWGYVRGRNGILLPPHHAQDEGDKQVSKITGPEATVIAAKAAVIASIIGGFFMLLNTAFSHYLDSGNTTPASSPSSNAESILKEDAVLQLRRKIYSDPNLAPEEKLFRLELLDNLFKQKKGSNSSGNPRVIPESQLIDKSTNKLILVETLNLLRTNEIRLSGVLHLIAANNLAIEESDVRSILSAYDERVRELRSNQSNLETRMHFVLSKKQRISDELAKELMKSLYLKDVHAINDSLETLRTIAVETKNQVSAHANGFLSIYAIIFAYLLTRRIRRKKQYVLIA